MKIETRLISGAGNTFHITFNEGAAFSGSAWGVSKMKETAKKICEAEPADGFIFLQMNKQGHFFWNFYNRDGSDAEMCGNATRCVGFFIKNILAYEENSWQLQTVAGLIRIDFVSSEEFKIIMTPIKKQPSSLGFFCDTGVPHLVLKRQTLETYSDLVLEARALRNHIEFLPKGTNVTYVAFTNENHKIKAVSYERGVEDFTQACGTGAMAAAFYNLTERAVTETQVEMPGGILKMNLTDLERPTMTGPAVLLGSYAN